MKENKPEKKRINIFLFFIYMVIVFCIVDALNQFIAPYLGRIMVYSKYGTTIIVETMAVIVIFVVMMLFHNYYVFIQKRKNFFASLGVGAFMLVFSIVRCLLSLVEGPFPKYDVISLAILGVTIGLFEEFLCRGWLLNEFIERYGKNRRSVVLCIFLSALIFGGMHVTNIWVGGQGVYQTIMQICQATAIGVLLGGIYYRTKNIWAVVFLHGFWDFAIMLGDNNILRQCNDLTPSNEVIMYLFKSTLAISIMFICVALFILRATKISPLIEGDVLDEKTKNRSIIRNIVLIGITVVSFLSMIIARAPSDADDYTVCYEYEERYLGDVDVHTSKYINNTIKYNDFEFKISRENDDIVLTNKNKDQIVLFEYDEELSYETVIFQNGQTFHVAIIELGEFYDGETVYYTTYIKTDNMSNEKEYLEEIKKSFKKYDFPTTKTNGYLTKRDDDYKYFYGETKLGTIVFIDEKENMYVLTDDDSKVPEEEPELPELEEKEETPEEPESEEKEEEKEETE
jgi:membrane protease YdiL (CAAX protease family)